MKATDKQLKYLHSLNDKLPEDQQIDRIAIMLAASDKFNGTKKISSMIDDCKGKLPQTETRVSGYTPAEDYGQRMERAVPQWYATRNGGGRDELDNQ